MKRLFFLASLLLLACGTAAYGHPSVNIFDNPSPGDSGQVHSNTGSLLPASLTHSESLSVTALTTSMALMGVTPGGAFSEDIQHIVLACDSDPAQIFDFVRNHVQFTPYFGFRKGAELTWLTRSGNDADQAELLATLLNAAGFPTQYEYGQISMPLQQGLDWFGVDDATALDQLRGSSGYPGVSDVGAGVLYMESIWVSVTAESSTYRLYPAFKTYTTLPGIDVETALVCRRVNGHTKKKLTAKRGSCLVLSAL